jgi:hypothetical protein
MNEFEKTMTVFGLSDEGKARAWEMLRPLGLSPDDRETTRVVVAVALDEATAKLERTMAAQVQAATSAIGRAGTAAAKEAKLSAEKQIAAAAAAMKASEAASVETIAAEVGKAGEKALVQIAEARALESKAWFVISVVAALTLAAVGGWKVHEYLTLTGLIHTLISDVQRDLMATAFLVGMFAPRVLMKLLTALGFGERNETEGA